MANVVSDVVINEGYTILVLMCFECYSSGVPYYMSVYKEIYHDKSLVFIITMAIYWPRW